MRFRPRHYVLIAIVITLGVYNLYRSHRVHRPEIVAVSPTPTGPAPQSAAWQAFDKTAAMRDAPDTTFLPTLHELQQQIGAAPADQKADLDGCQNWLLFYRQNAHASAQDAWRQRSTQHLNSCVAQHRDISS